MHLFTIPHWINLAWAVLVAGVVFWKGGWREKMIVAAQAVMVLVNQVACHAGECWRLGEPAAHVARLVVEDAVILAFCLVATVGAKRYWVLALASIELLWLTTDVIGAEYASITPWAWLSAGVMWFWLANGILLWGALTTARDRARAAT